MIKSLRQVLETVKMLNRNDPEFRKLIEKGISLDRLEKRLRPALGLRDYLKEKEAHDGFGNYSERGFLGTDESLLDVVHADWQTVEALGTTHSVIAGAFHRLTQGGYDVHSDYEYKPAEDLTDGSQPCPWDCLGANGVNVGMLFKRDLPSADKFIGYLTHFPFPPSWGEEEIEAHALREFGEAITIGQLREAVERRKTREEPVYVVANSLLPHLIGEHYFFEGRGSPFRADPSFLARAFNLTKK